MKVGGTASITAITQIITMVLMGFLVGQWMGWKQMDSIFRVILSISSTTLFLRPLNWA
jgi:CPA2 family monovalent cation:H+ antiporter-2